MEKIFQIVFIVIGVIVGAFILLNVFSLVNTRYASQTNKAASENTDNLNSNTQKEVKDADKLSIEVLTEGTGEGAKDGDTLVVNYVGRLLDGTQFDSSYDRGTPFTLTLGAGQVIDGWEQGLQGIKVGEKRKITIPSSLGYGKTGSGTAIPANAGLEFEVELLEIKK